MVTPEDIEAKLAVILQPVLGMPVKTSEEGTVPLELDDLFMRMRTFHHNDDEHHQGETVIEHITDVYNNVEQLTQGWPEDRRALLQMTALLHDLGKAYTYKYRPEKGRHTFYDHWRVSADITRTLLTDGIAWPGFTERVWDLVRLHDVFFMLANDRARAKGLKYIKKFAEEAISHGADLDNLVTFAHADSLTSRTYRETADKIAAVLDDLEQYRAEAERKEREASGAAQQARINLDRHWEEIAEIVDQAVPGSSRKLPDIKALNKVLGEKKQFKAIQQIQAILRR